MKIDEVLDRLPQGIFTLRDRVAQVLGIIANPPTTAAQEGEPPTDLVAENKRLRDRLLTLEAVARNVVSDLAKERRLVYEDFDDGAIESAAKDTTETSAIELAKVLGGDTIPEWALNPIAIELPFESLEKMHQLLVDPPRPSERLRAAARRVREDRIDKRNTNGGMGKTGGGGRLSLCSLCEGACLSCDECRSTNLSIALCEFWRDGFKFHHGGGWVQRKRSTESIFEARNFVRGLHEPGERGWWNRQALRMRLMGSIVPSEQALGCQPANAEFGALLTQLLRVDNVPPFLKQAPSTDAERGGG